MYVLTKYNSDMEEIEVMGSSPYFTVCWHFAHEDAQALTDCEAITGITRGNVCEESDTIFYKSYLGAILNVWKITEIPTLEIKNVRI